VNNLIAPFEKTADCCDFGTWCRRRTLIRKKTIRNQRRGATIALGGSLVGCFSNRLQPKRGALEAPLSGLN
jgi:hypothetical protein